MIGAPITEIVIMVYPLLFMLIIAAIVYLSVRMERLALDEDERDLNRRTHEMLDRCNHLLNSLPEAGEDCSGPRANGVDGTRTGGANGSRVLPHAEDGKEESPLAQFVPLEDGDRLASRVCVCGSEAIVYRTVREPDSFHARQDVGLVLDEVGPWCECLECGAWANYF